MHGIFNFSATPLAPPGTKVVALVDPTQRASWELNGEVGWYVGPALNHYRCVECYFPRTRATRTCDTVIFFPHKAPFPTITTQDYLKQAADDIIHILLHPPSTTVPTLAAGDPVRAALLELATTLQRVQPVPVRPEPTIPITMTPAAPSPRVETPASPRTEPPAVPRVGPTNG